MKKYDLIVIGTGSTGATVAYMARDVKWKVAIIDSLPFGGTCALRGCDPKKILVGAAEIVERGIGIKNKGISEIPKLNWGDLMKFKNSFTNPIPKSNESAFRKAGIDTYHGQAVFSDKNKIQVKNNELEGKYIVIATGSTPRKLNILGEEFITKSDEFLELKKLPKEIIFAGGGYVSFELAHVAALAGAKVKIIHRGDKVLKQFDRDLVKMLVKEFNEIGIEIILNSSVNSIKKKGNKLILKARNKTYKTDMVVHGAGRIPDIENLKLEDANVKSNEKGIIVNSYLQTSNPKIYAGGDVATLGLPLTPVAGLQGKIIGNNLLNKSKIKFDGSITVSVVFTYPPLVSVGLTEEEIKKKRIKYKKKFAETSSWYNPRRIGLKNSGYKILVNRKNKILGAHIFYPNSDEIINLFLFAMKNNMKSEEMKDYLMAYPSSSYDIKYMI